MRRARIKAVANVPIRRKVDDKNKTDELTKEEESPATQTISVLEPKAVEEVDSTNIETVSNKDRSSRIRLVAKIPIRRSNKIEEPTEHVTSVDEIVTKELSFVRPEENNDTIVRPSPVTSPAITHRPRIRSTPRLDGHYHHRVGDRRNSTSASESDDEYNRRTNRNRLDSIGNLSQTNDSVTSITIAPKTAQTDNLVIVDEANHQSSNEDQINKNILSPKRNNVSIKESIPLPSLTTPPSATQSTIKRKVRRSDIARKMAEAKRDFYNKFGTKTPDRHKLTMMDLIFYNPTSNPMLSKTSTSNKTITNNVDLIDNESIHSQSSSLALSVRGADEEVVDDPAEDDTLQQQPVPQVKIGENGEIILDEQSVIIETTDQQIQRINKSRELTETAINYDELNTTYGIYKRAKRTKDWSIQETKQFYRVLQMIGTDFSLMLTYFKNRTRRDLKLKFKKEEKINRHLIDKVLLNPCTFDLEQLQQTLDKDMELLNQQQLETEHLIQLKKNQIQKRKRKDGEKRVRYKTGSWFARQMYNDKTEMIQAYDDDEDDPQGVSVPTEALESSTNNEELSSSVDENQLNHNVTIDEGDGGEKPLTKKRKTDEDEETSKLVSAMFGKQGDTTTTRCGRKIRSKSIIQENMIEEQNKTVQENENENLSSEGSSLNTNKSSCSEVTNPFSEQQHHHLLTIINTNNDDVKTTCTKNLINNNNNNNNDNKLKEILENYLGHNDSIILELPVVRTDTTSTECTTMSESNNDQ